MCLMRCLHSTKPMQNKYTYGFGRLRILLWRKTESKIDLYFCGVDTDRTAIINAISKIEKLDFSMDLIQIENNNQYKDERISTHTVDEIMPYEVVLKRTLEANCVLEIVRPGQVGFTAQNV